MVQQKFEPSCPLMLHDLSLSQKLPQIVNDMTFDCDVSGNNNCHVKRHTRNDAKGKMQDTRVSRLAQQPLIEL